MRLLPNTLLMLAAALTPSAAFAPSRSRPRVTATVRRASSSSRWLRASLESITVDPIELCTGTVVLPGSKSLSNRALLLAALSEGTTTVENLLDSDDISYMLKALAQLGIEIEEVGDTYKIVGNGGPFAAQECDVSGGQSSCDLFLGNAGTAMRPLAAALCFGEGDFVLDGVERMRERPIADLVDGLTQLGAEVSCSDTGCPPVTISAKVIEGGVARISGQISSQFLSALLMAAPLAKGDVVIEITDELVSAPYVLLTIGLMKKFGINVQNEDNKRFTVAGGQKYVTPGTVFVEGDASSASYFLALGAVTGGPVKVVGCGSESVQGDVNFAKVLEQMGATVEWEANSITVSRPEGKKLVGVDVDCDEIPDAAMTLAPVALFAEGPTKIRNVYNWRLKECDRMSAICTELGKLGVEVEEARDYCVIQPPAAGAIKPSVAIDTYDDHRMAMCFALVACGGVPVVINDPGCTSKTFPDYFEKLASVRT